MSEKKSESDDSKAEESAESLNPNVQTGLTSAEVVERLKRFGFNEALEKRPSAVLAFLRKFWGLTSWMLEIIIVLSWFLQRYADLYIVTGLLVFNAVLSFLEEQRASSAVEALKEKLRVNARVLRDGNWKLVPARELVPDDVIRVRSGDFVPADVRIQGQVSVDQSALTGESRIVEKMPNNLLYSGSIVKRGNQMDLLSRSGSRPILEERFSWFRWPSRNCILKQWFRTL